jgi:hypothetical protein
MTPADWRAPSPLPSWLTKTLRACETAGCARRTSGALCRHCAALKRGPLGLQSRAVLTPEAREAIRLGGLRGALKRKQRRLA